jgi:hypothetical protein
MTVLFVVSILLSTISQTVEFSWLNKDYEDYLRLRISYIIKSIIVAFSVIISVVLVHARENGAYTIGSSFREEAAFGGCSM